jgi:Tfp pilus assembly protein PilO
VEIKNRQQVLLLAAIGAIALFAGDKLVLTPLTSAWKARSARITELRVQVEQGKSLLDREQGIRSRWEQMRRNALPTSTSAAEQQFFKAVDQWAQDSRVGITAITPQWKHDADDYVTYQCRVEASGNLASLSKFLYDVEREPSALKLDAIELKTVDKEGQQLTLGVQISGLVLTTTAK